MPMPVYEEIRRARDDDDDDPNDQEEEYFESVADIWKHATTFPTVVTFMDKPWTIYSTGLPPWVTSAIDDKTDSPPSSVQTNAPSTFTSSVIALSQPTSVSLATEFSGPGAHASSSPTPTSTTASGYGAASNTASSAASTSCAISTDVEGQSNGAASPSTVSSGYNGSNGAVTNHSGSNTDKNQDDSGGPPLGLILAGVIIPVLVISFLAFTAFIVMRRRKQRKLAERALGHEEMKLHPNDDVPPPGPNSREALVVVPGPPPPMIREPSPQQTAAVPPPPRAVTPVPAPPPVIVSAMNPANNASYFTGIDTSEALSIRTNSVRSSGPQQRPAGFMLDGEFHEEPPPPYRPRSVPPISRDSSMRTANYRSAADCASIQLAHDNRESRSTIVVNPFVDPSDDSVSIMEEEDVPMNPFMREEDDVDRLSDVSDLSYQREPTTVHQGV